MQITLKDCCHSIRAGQTFKKSLDQYPSGDLAVLLPRYIIGDRVENPIYIDPVEVPSLAKHLLQKGEILVINKGDKFNSAIYQGEPSQAIATTACYVLTPGEIILPEYLHWYLNQREAKEYFLANTSGSTVRILTKKTLEDLPVPIISLENQQYICSLIFESQTEQALLRELIRKKEEFVESYIWEHIQQCK